MPNFIEIGGVTRKPLFDLTRNDPILSSAAIILKVYYFINFTFLAVGFLLEVNEIMI